jgi:hypothetical protein
MAALSGGARAVLLIRGYRGSKADRLVTRIDPGAASLVVELPGLSRPGLPARGNQPRAAS